MKTLLATLLTLLLAGWLATVMSLAEPPRVYVWTVEPVTVPPGTGTAPPSEGVGEGSQTPLGVLSV